MKLTAIGTAMVLKQLLQLIFLMPMIVRHDFQRVRIIVFILIIITFLPGSYRKTVPEDVTIGSSLLNVTASDADSYPNNITCYSILADVSKAGN